MTDNEIYIANAQEYIAFSLDTLSIEDPLIYNDSLTKILPLLGSNTAVDVQLKRLFHYIETTAYDIKSNEKAKALWQINFLLSLRYGNARHVPESFCTCLTRAIMTFIEQHRVIKSYLTNKDHKDRFFELEMLWIGLVIQIQMLMK